MNFLFSTVIDRPAFLGRFILAHVIFFIGAYIACRVAQIDSDSLLSLLTAPSAIACWVLPVLLGFYYLMRFAVLARLLSIDLSPWYSFGILLPWLCLLFEIIKWAHLVPGDFVLDWFAIACAVLYLLFLFILLAAPDGSGRRSVVLDIIHEVETGQGQILVRIVPLTITLLIIGVVYDFGPFNIGFASVGGIYRGLNDAQSMDNAQLARQIVQRQGYTTKFLRPYAITQLHDYRSHRGLGDLFPANQFPQGTQRILPDTYNAPGYPFLLAGWFALVHPNFAQTGDDIRKTHMYSGDRWIPPLNQILLILTMLLVFFMGRRLFDERVAWMAAVTFITTNLLWQYTVTALSTTFVMFFVTVVLFCAMEIYQAGETALENEGVSMRPAWFWSILLGLVLGAACLTKLYLLILLVPLLLVFIVMPKANPLLYIMVALLALGLVAPWFWHAYKVCGNPLGSNLPLLVYGEGDYRGNEIFCKTSIPPYESLFGLVSTKEFAGFQWHFEHFWSLLGSNLMVLLFGASLLYAFKRRRAQIFIWLVMGCGVALIAANSVCVENPGALGPWNILVTLLPAVVVVGSAFFFILLDRFNFHVGMLNNLIVIAFLMVNAFPLTQSLTTANNQFYSFPPYMPNVISLLGHLAEPEEWVTSDMPWATAWYADHASLWLPDTVADFNDLNDNVCPSGLLLFTPVTWSQPIANLPDHLRGQDKDWMPFIIGGAMPDHFPFHVHLMVPAGGPDYLIWSDRPRWESR